MSDSDLPEDAEQPKIKERPNCHHYTFAHVALRQMAFSHPVGCLGVLASPDATKFLSDIWKDVDEHCKKRGETSTINPREFVVHKLCLGDYPCAIIEMPEPWFVTGAYFIGIVLKVPINEIDPNDRDAPVDYFTLEKTVDFDNAPPAILCAWTKEGSHVNFGTGSEPTVAAFIAELEKRMKKEAESSDQ
jgi:hypothetical protein